ncbi:MAG TPA: ester cyclase [Solirubrobacteraceae bacterium]|jgi:steroid delta-isomerase-like uncharacterized protein|nr:ester cyclase [Solirubrobacteraceae bacterium]
MDPAASLRRFYELISSGDIDALMDLFADDFVEHEEMPEMPPDRDGTRQLFGMLLVAFPDMKWAPQDVLVDGDKAVARVRFSGTNDGEFMGMPATGKSVNVQVIDIVRFGPDGLAREHWGVLDMMGLMTQLGAIPGPPA